jgi:hypothetical protein
VQLTEPLTGTGPGVPSVMQDGQEIGAQLGSAQALVTIVEDDLYFVNLSSPNYSASEGAGEALITVLRSGLPTFLAQAQDIDIIAVTAGSGTTAPVAGQDFVDLGASPDDPLARVVARDAQFRFAPNETAKIFRVPLLNDDFVDGPKNFLVYIRSAVNHGTPGGPGLTEPRSAPLVVTDDDAGGTIEFSSAAYAVAEDTPSGLAIIHPVAQRRASPGDGAGANDSAGRADSVRARAARHRLQHREHDGDLQRGRCRSRRSRCRSSTTGPPTASRP